MTVYIAADEPATAAALAVRRTVFVEEQGIDPELDFDGHDQEATHFLAVAEGAEAVGEVDGGDPEIPALDSGRPVVGTARLREEVAGVGRGERLAVVEPYRGAGHGHELTEAFLDESARRGDDALVVHAQADNVEFCRAHGFEAVGEPFIEAGIEHREMRHDLADRPKAADPPKQLSATDLDRPTEERPRTE